MKKLKYILASLVLAVGFTSCETEAIDEKVLDETTPGTPILRFELNDQQTVVTDKVTFEWAGGDAFTLRAKLSILNIEDQNLENNDEKYFAGYLTINYNIFSVGHFPTSLSLDDLANSVSSATLEIQIINEEGDREWTSYSTLNADEGQDAGFSNISKINDQAHYINGDFDYILYPDEDGGVTPQRVTVGSFHYINYEATESGEEEIQL